MSGLLAPIMLLSGHSGEVFTARFNPDGDILASGSHDKHIFLWRVYGECENYMMMQGAAVEGMACVHGWVGINRMIYNKWCRAHPLVTVTNVHTGHGECEQQLQDTWAASQRWSVAKLCTS